MYEPNQCNLTCVVARTLITLIALNWGVKSHREYLEYEKKTYSSHPDGHLQLAQHSPVGLLTWCPIMPLKHHQTWASWHDQHHETININLSMYPLVCDTSLSTKHPATQHETSAWLLPGFFLELALEPHDAASKQQVNCWVPVGLLMRVFGSKLGTAKIAIVGAKDIWRHHNIPLEVEGSDITRGAMKGPHVGFDPGLPLLACGKSF